MKKGLLSLVLSLVIIASGAVAMVGAAEPATIPLDFTKYHVIGAGEWLSEAVGNGYQVTQRKASGGEAVFLFDGITLPNNFSFSAELGCIEGNNAAQRPYFGLYINHDDTNYIVFRFRPSQKQYEVAKAATGSSLVLGTFADPNPWAWDLQEWRTMRLERKGSTINAYVNDQLYISIEYNEHAGGNVGFFTYSTAAVFRNVKLSAL